MKVNPVERALEVFTKIRSVIDDNSKLGEDFETRARSLVSMISELGLVPTLSFCYGKAQQDIFKSVYESFSSGKALPKNKETTKQSYALYLIVVLYYLKELRLVGDFSRPDELIKTLHDMSQGNKAYLYSKLLMPYLIEIKRMAEALYGK